ncbi:MAG: undecaprenyl/decaprenyl-phosphate alpha-N-acetylglucosaminyl 1-phosphate transferase [Acidobacteriaceae bacterium]|nr:undecaprenyl/decaprenyl-phosphate alpha-N-acetylglucosaminyl 1-phosphate transferase [Acidobacteriaceae bacterium]
MLIASLATFLCSVFFSFISTKWVRDVANRQGWVIPPASVHHLHTRALPRLGGVAIFASFLASFGLTLLFAYRALAVPGRTVLTIISAGALIFLLGLYDDFFSAGPWLKFTVQGLAATLLFAGGLRILDLPVLFGNHHFPWFFSLPLTILWVVAITNAFNLIDGLDGLAAGSALFSTLVVFTVAVVSGVSLVSLMAIALVGAILGFLRFNFSPATIFLGDCGSLFIGFTLSALALQGAQKAPTIIAVAIPVVSFGLPILESTLSVLRRYLSGRPVFTADREHIHHKLLQRGLSQRQVVITLYAVSAIFALLSLFLLWPTERTLGLVLAVLGTGVWIGVQHLGYLEFGELKRVAQRTIERQIIINNLAWRRAAEELKVTSDYAQVCRVLMAALTNNDFDAFDLQLYVAGSDLPQMRGLELISPWGAEPYLRWTNPITYSEASLAGRCSLRIDLVSSRGRHCGSMTVYRQDSSREVQLDLNLLICSFPQVLADALERCAERSEVVSLVASSADLLTA